MGDNATEVRPDDRAPFTLGVPFHTVPVFFRGACTANQVPVWRAFDGVPHRRVESNHRFSTERSVIDGMVSQGCIMEGIAFCVDAAQ
jgi:hypothetical protein